MGICLFMCGGNRCPSSRRPEKNLPYNDKNKYISSDVVADEIIMGAAKVVMLIYLDQHNLLFHDVNHNWNGWYRPLTFVEEVQMN